MGETVNFSPDAVATIARHLLGEENRRLSTRRDLRFGRRGSLSVIPERGVFRDHESDAQGGVLDLVVYAGAAKDRRAAAELLELNGNLPRRETPRERHERAERETRERQARQAAAAALWRQGARLKGTIAETYLRQARAIVAAPLDSPELRFCPAAPLTPYRPDGRTAPALLARASRRAGERTGVHVTYLRPDGLGKADLPTPRKMLGVMAGAHVPLMAGPTLVVAEGIESALSAWEIAAGEIGPHGLGAAAGLSAIGLKAFAWPAQTVGLIIAPDRDASGAGEHAAKELGRRAASAGLKVGLLWPPEGFSDWNAAACAAVGA